MPEHQTAWRSLRVAGWSSAKQATAAAEGPPVMVAAWLEQAPPGPASWPSTASA